MCLGDYNQDGRCDVLLTRPHGGARLYRNEGDFRFLDVTRDAKVEEFDSWTTGAAFVDLNNDGWLDLFICGFLSPNHVYLNQRDGTFREVTFGSGLEQQGAHVKMIFADYDRDGDLDAFLVTNRREPRAPLSVKYLGKPGQYTVAPEHQEWVGVMNLPGGEQRFVKAGQRDYLFRNDWVETGNLHFTDVTDHSGIQGFYHGLDAIWWDYDQDGYPDLYVGNDFTDPDQFYHNLGNGTFQEESARWLTRTPWSTMACGVGDFNNDGLPDLFLADMAGTSPQRHVVAMASMETMGWFLDWAEPPQYLRNTLFLNTGGPRFLEMAELAGVARSDWSWSAKVGDLDEDGREDLFISNGFTRDYLDIDFLQAFRRSGAVETPSMWAKAPELRERNLAFQNRGVAVFQDVSRSWGLDELGISFGAALGDLDGDGDLDLVVNHFDAAPGLYRNTSHQTHRLTLRLQGNQNAFGIGAEVRVETDSGTQLRQLHPGNGYMSSDEPLLHFGLGIHPTVNRLSIRWPSGRVQELSQVAGDRLVTIHEPGSETTSPSNHPNAGARSSSALYQPADCLAGLRHQERVFNDFDREPLLPHKLSQLGPGLAWGDVNGDGLSDLFLGGAAGQIGQFRLQVREGRFEPVAPPAFAADAEKEDMGCLFFDYDSDGDLDLLVVSGGNEADAGNSVFQDRLYRNDGPGRGGEVQWTRTTNALPSEVESGGPVCAWDFDRDGDLDLFIGGRLVPGSYPVAPRSLLLENRGGRFVSVAPERAPGLERVGMVTDVVASDFDGDGWIDLVVTLDQGAVHFFRNQKGNLADVTYGTGVSKWWGAWGGIAAADVDRDGDVDYVVSNQGRNLPFAPSPEHPLITYYADWDGSGRSNVVVGRVNGQDTYPVRTRGALGAALPFTRELVASYAEYGRTTLSTLLGKERLASARQGEVNQSDSGVLLNDGAGHFRFQAFPHEVQNAPGFGLALLHANDDVHLDVFLCQNLTPVERESGKQNSGLSWLLVGRGDGTFQAVWPRESGIAVRGDARAVRAVDLSGHGAVDLVVAVNNAPAEVFRSVGSAFSNELTVRLRGGARAGNRLAIGARVLVTSRLGRRELREVYSSRENEVRGSAELRFRFDPNDAAKSVQIRWPRGQLTDRDLTGTERSVDVDEP